MTSHPTLFGRKMRSHGVMRHQIGAASVVGRTYSEKTVYYGAHNESPRLVTNDFKSPHAAARALERKIVAAHRRLGKLMGKERA